VFVRVARRSYCPRGKPQTNFPLGGTVVTSLYKISLSYLICYASHYARSEINLFFISISKKTIFSL
jgi:hypothetical protein